MRSSRRSARRDRRSPGIATFDRGGALVRLLSLCLRPARDARHERWRHPALHESRGARVGGARRAPLGDAVSRSSSPARSCVAAFAGIHQAMMPQARVETISPTRPCISAASSSKAISAAPSSRTAPSPCARSASNIPSRRNASSCPTDTPITFRATSADVVHGFLIEGTNVNTMLVPGYISPIAARFDHAGRASDAVP